MSDNEYNASSDPVTEEMEAVWRYTEIGRMVNQDGQPDLASCTRCLRDQVHCQPSGGTESCTNCINTGHTNSCNVNGLSEHADA